MGQRLARPFDMPFGIYKNWVSEDLSFLPLICNDRLISGESFRTEKFVPEDLNNIDYVADTLIALVGRDELKRGARSASFRKKKFSNCTVIMKPSRSIPVDFAID